LNFPIEIKAVAFDLDGTLVETLPDLHESASRMLAQIGRPPVSESVVRAYVGDGVDRLVKRLLSGTPDGEPDAASFENAAQDFRSHYAAVLTRASHPFAGATSVLESLRGRGFKLACVTNKPACFTEPLLQRLGLTGYLDLVLSGDSLARKKPDPLPLIKTCEALGVEPSRTLMIGDSSNDARAARAAGCPVVLVSYGYNHGEPVHAVDADGVIDRLDRL